MDKPCSIPGVISIIDGKQFGCTFTSLVVSEALGYDVNKGLEVDFLAIAKLYQHKKGYFSKSSTIW